MATTAKIAKEDSNQGQNRSRQGRIKVTPRGQDPAAQPVFPLRPAARLHPQIQLCRICFRQLALAGEVPGVIKASW